MQSTLHHIKQIAFGAVALTTLLAGSGCSTAKTYSFSVSLKNATNEPVTVWLTKRGGPDENDWLAPEALSETTAAQLDAISGVTIPAGKTGDIGPLKGKFDVGSLAILRVYAGQLSYQQILATSNDGKLRVDLPLREGENKLTVRAPLSVARD